MNISYKIVDETLHINMIDRVSVKLLIRGEHSMILIGKYEDLPFNNFDTLCICTLRKVISAIKQSTFNSSLPAVLEYLRKVLNVKRSRYIQNDKNEYQDFIKTYIQIGGRLYENCCH